MFSKSNNLMFLGITFAILALGWSTPISGPQQLKDEEINLSTAVRLEILPMCQAQINEMKSANKFPADICENISERAILERNWLSYGLVFNARLANNGDCDFSYRYSIVEYYESIRCANGVFTSRRSFTLSKLGKMIFKLFGLPVNQLETISTQETL